MLTEKTNAVQSKAVEHEDQTLQAIQTERLVLIKHYQSLYKQHQALLERCPTSHGPYLECTYKVHNETVNFKLYPEVAPL